MTHEQKISYMRIACGICKFGFNDEQLDLMVSLYELVLEKEGETNVRDAVNVESIVKERANIKSRSELLDKVSTKV